jgi:hypothetical protein
MNDKPEIGDIEAITVIGMSFAHQLDTAKNLVFQTHIPTTSSPEYINSTLDKLVNAAERQRARVRIPELEMTIKTKEDFLTRAQSEMFRIDKERELLIEQTEKQWQASGKRGLAKMSTFQANEDQKALGQRNQAQQNFELTEQQLIDHRNELAKLKALVGEV